eukprot:5397566-Pleurochrysis_carterae.AAC.1
MQRQMVERVRLVSLGCDRDGARYWQLPCAGADRQPDAHGSSGGGGGGGGGGGDGCGAGGGGGGGETGGPGAGADGGLLGG